MKDPVQLFLNWVLFPSPAQEASDERTPALQSRCRRAGGETLAFFPPAVGIGSMPQAQTGAGVSLWSCARVFPLPHEPPLPARLTPHGRQGGTGSLPARCPGFGEPAHSACRKRHTLQGSLLTAPGCTEPFVLQHPSLKITRDASRMGQHQTSRPAWTSFLKALALVPVGGHEADGPLAAHRVNKV